MTQASLPPAVLTGIYVRGLFGRTDYDIAIDAGIPAVLTGANGTGKSTILRVVHAIASGDMASLFHAPIAEITLSFDGLPDLNIWPEAPNGVLHVRYGTLKASLEVVVDPQVPDWVKRALEASGYDLEKTRSSLWENARNEGLSFMVARRAIETLDRISSPFFVKESPSWLEDLQEQFQVLYVTDQRLIVDDPTDQRRADRSLREPAHRAVGDGPHRKRTQQLAVEAASRDIGERLSRAGLDYARESQRIDRNFPNEVIRAMRASEDVTADEVEELNSKVTAQRETLREVGLLDRDPSYQPPIGSGESLATREVRTAVAAVLRSDLRKLEVLVRQSAELSDFKNFLERRLAPKRVHLGSDGIRVSLPSGNVVRVGELSSGEQHIMVLAYEILFRAANNTLVIIDEPELSLHIAWQADLLRDLVEMGQRSDIQFLMATHSATLIASLPEAERSLDRLAK